VVEKARKSKIKRNKKYQSIYVERFRVDE